jgi:hypothetical protein
MMPTEQKPNTSLFDNIRLIIYFSLIPIVLVIILGTTFHFFYRRYHPIIYNRDVPLTLLNVVANMVVSMLHLTKVINYYNYPCFIMLWIPALVYPLYVLTVFARLTRVVFMYRLSEARLEAIDLRTLPMRNYNGLNTAVTTSGSHDPEKMVKFKIDSWSMPRNETFSMNHHHDVILTTSESSETAPKINSLDNVPSHCHWSLTYRRRFTTRALCSTIGALLLMHVVLTLAMQLRYPAEFTWIPANLGRCNYSAAYLPLWTACGLYIIIIAPFIVYHAHGIHDAYGIRTEHYCSQGIALVFFTLYFLFKWLGFDNSDVFPAAMWLVIGTFINHLWTVARPAWLTERHLKGNHRRDNSSSLERIQGIAEFKMLLDDPIWRREFRLYSVRDFSVENILFYEEVMRLQTARFATNNLHRPSASYHKKDNGHELEMIPEASAEGINEHIPAASLPNSGFTESSSGLSPNLAHSHSFGRSSQISGTPTLGEGYAEDDILTYYNSVHSNNQQQHHNNIIISNTTKKLTYSHSTGVTNQMLREPSSTSIANTHTTINSARVVPSSSYMDHHYEQQQQSQQYHYSSSSRKNSSNSNDGCDNGTTNTATFESNMLSVDPTLPDELVHGLREIYKLFLEPDAEYELNLSHQVLHTLLQQFKQNELSTDMLQPAMNEILMLMYLNTYPRFLEWVEQQDRLKQGSRRGRNKRWSLGPALTKQQW